MNCMTLRDVRHFCLRACVASMLLTIVVPAQAEGELEAPPAPSQAEVERWWKRHWFKYAKQSTMINGRYFISSVYSPKYKSSRLQTAQNYIDEHSTKRRVSLGSNLYRTVKEGPHRVDVDVFIRAIPELAVGEYGHIYSAKIDSIDGPDSMTISEIWMMDVEQFREEVQKAEAQVEAVERENERLKRNESDRDRSNRRRTRVTKEQRQQQRDAEQQRKRLVENSRKDLERATKLRNKLAEAQESGEFNQPVKVHGIPTHAMREGKRWRPSGKDGAQLVIVSRAKGEGSSRQLVAVSGQAFKKAFKEPDFLQLLAAAGLDKTGFVSLILKAREDDKDEDAVQRRVVDALARRLESPEASSAAVASSNDSEPAPSEPAETEPAEEPLPLDELRAIQSARQKLDKPPTGPDF